MQLKLQLGNVRRGCLSPIQVLQCCECVDKTVSNITFWPTLKLVSLIQIRLYLLAVEKVFGEEGLDTKTNLKQTSKHSYRYSYIRTRIFLTTTGNSLSVCASTVLSCIKTSE